MKAVHLGWTIGVHRILMLAVTVSLRLARLPAQLAAKKERTLREIQASPEHKFKMGVFQQPLAKFFVIQGSQRIMKWMALL